MSKKILSNDNNDGREMIFPLDPKWLTDTPGELIGVTPKLIPTASLKGEAKEMIDNIQKGMAEQAEKMASEMLRGRTAIYGITPGRVIFHPPATIIYWRDGSKTVVKCKDMENWSDYIGVALCCLKKLMGNKGNYNNTIRTMVEHGNKIKSKGADKALLLGPEFTPDEHDCHYRQVEKAVRATSCVYCLDLGIHKGFDYALLTERRTADDEHRAEVPVLFCPYCGRDLYNG